MWQIEDVSDRRGLSVFSPKQCCDQVTASTARPQEYPGVLHVDRQIKRSFISLFPCSAAAVVPLCLGLPGCDSLPFVKQGSYGCPCPLQQRAYCVRARSADPARAVKPASPRQDSSAGFIRQVSAEKALGSSVGTCCGRGDVAGGRQEARTGWCCLEGYCTVPLGED